MRQNAPMPETRLTLQTALTAIEVKELSAVAPFEAVQDQGLHWVFFADADARDKVSEALRRRREGQQI